MINGQSDTKLTEINARNSGASIPIPLVNPAGNDLSRLFTLSDWNNVLESQVFFFLEII